MSRPHRLRRLTAILGGLLLFGTGVGALMEWRAPEVLEAGMDGLHRQVSEQVQPRDNDGLPVIELGPPGGLAELHRCTRVFIEMASYRATGIPPTYAAHNLCGGDILLGWSRGQLLRIKGRSGIYEAYDIVSIPKLTAEVADLKKVRGDLILQTCYYGVQRMRLVGVRLVSGSAAP